MHMWYVCMLVCFCFVVCLEYWYLVCKAFSGFSMDLSSSIQLEDIGFINSAGDCWHTQAWIKELIKPCAWRS